MEASEQIRNFIMKHIVVFEDEARFSDSDDIFALGIVNSIFSVGLLNYLEKEYKLEIGEEDMELDNFRSIHNILQFIYNKNSGV